MNLLELRKNKGLNDFLEIINDKINYQRLQVIASDVNNKDFEVFTIIVKSNNFCVLSLNKLNNEYYIRDTYKDLKINIDEEEYLKIKKILIEKSTEKEKNEK